MKTLLWDLDGTLLTTGGAGATPFKIAIEYVLGEKIDFDLKANAGLTDHQIAAKYVQGRVEKSELDEVVESIVEAYSSQLENTFTKNKVESFPGISSLLSLLKVDVDFQQVVVTGNCRNGAFAKLKSAALFSFFQEEDIFFSIDLSPRSEIVRKALREERISVHESILIGDTRYDLEAAIQCSLPIVLVSHKEKEFSFEWNTYQNSHVIGPNWSVSEFITLLKNI